MLSSSTDIVIQSRGYALGGFDPIVSLFRGSGDSAVFLDLNDDEVSGSILDSLLTFAALPADTYTLAVTYASNAPNAYYWGGGTLGDGFIGLGDQDLTRTEDFKVDVLLPDSPVPEPAGIVLLGTVALVLLLLV